MKCPKCGMKLPDDSAFCQFCGISIVDYLVSNGFPSSDDMRHSPNDDPKTDLKKEISPEPQQIRVETEIHNNQSRRCKKCGGEIDGATKQCKSCGKQYLRAKTVIPIILLVLLLATSCVFNVAQYKYSQKLESDIAEKEEKISELNLSVSKSLKTLRNAQWELSFYQEHAVVVPDDGSGIYHTHGCSHMDNTSFWIYNIEAAIGLGYSPCPYCQGG